jgi:hypothetical protein
MVVRRMRSWIAESGDESVFEGLRDWRLGVEALATSDALPELVDPRDVGGDGT